MSRLAHTSPSPTEIASALSARMRSHDAKVPTSSLGRLWGAGRSALGVASLMSANRRGQDVDPAAVARVVERLGSLKGLAMKAGQMLGYVDAGMPPGVQSMLATLQTSAPTTPYEDVVATLRRSLGDRAEPLIATLGREPIAIASIGQVHRATLADGSEVAVKVRHPGVEAAIAADFRSAALGRAVAAMAGMSAVGGVIDEARAAFMEECDYSLEAERQTRFAGIFADDPDIAVPAVILSLSSRDVLVTRWLPGRSLETFLAEAPDQTRRDRVGAALFRFWVRTLYSDGLFHADPHPGNFALLDDGRVVIYDYGCVRTFLPELRIGFARLAAATRRDDVHAMVDALRALGGRAPTRNEDLRRLLRAFFAPLLVPGRRRLALEASREARNLMADKRTLLGLELPGRMLFLFRLRFGLYALLARLEAEVDWAGLEAGWAADANPMRSSR